MALALAFESSCDETGVALVQDGKRVLAAPLYSQIEEHRPYGGVIPEYASRAHLEKFTLLLSQILKENALQPGSIDYVAATTRPGLVGGLLVGYQSAKACARFFSVPFFGVHHLEAHLAAVTLSGHVMPYPSLGLVLSGGNSVVYRLGGPGKAQVLGDTLDDAAGEALDKAAQILGLGYPGGPKIEEAALRFFESGITQASQNNFGDENPFPVILKSLPRDKVQFSFSGIKTSLLRLTEKLNTQDIDRLAFFFQERVIQHILQNVEHALWQNKNLPLIAAGGVMANRLLRERLETLCKKYKTPLLIPEKKYATDNAAMVAAAAHLYFERGLVSPFSQVTASNAFP